MAIDAVMASYNGLCCVLTAIFFPFNYKILSRFVALIYFIMNEKNPKRIYFNFICHLFSTFNYLEAEA